MSHCAANSLHQKVQISKTHTTPAQASLPPPPASRGNCNGDTRTLTLVEQCLDRAVANTPDLASFVAPNAVRALSLNIQGIASHATRKKIKRLLNYADKYKYNLLLLQETKCSMGLVHETVRRYRGTQYFKVLEAPNPRNSAKGGVAIISLHAELDLTSVHVDSTEDDNWTEGNFFDNYPRHRRLISPDDILGKWQYATIQYHGMAVSVLNLYAPSSNSHLRSAFYDYLDDHAYSPGNLIVGGDWNNKITADDVIRADDTQPALENVDTALNFIASRDLHDTLIDQRVDDGSPLPMTNRSTTTTVRQDGTTVPSSYSRIDRWYHSNDLQGMVKIEHITSATDVDPLGIATTHYPIEIVIDDKHDLETRQYRHIWRANTSVLRQTDVRQHLQQLLRSEYALIAHSDGATKTSAWDRFKNKCRNYLRGRQDAQHKDRTRNMARLQATLAPTFDHTSLEQAEATAELEAILTKEDTESFFNHTVQSMTEDCQMTRAHFATATRRKPASTIAEVTMPDNSVSRKQEDIEERHAEHWLEGVLSANPTDDDARAHVINCIHRRCTPEQRDALGGDSVAPGDDNLVTRDNINDAIEQMRLGRSPGSDGLPIEFYEMLQWDNATTEDTTLVDWLHAVYHHAFASGQLPRSMRDIQIRLLFKKDTTVQRRSPANYRPIYPF